MDGNLFISEILMTTIAFISLAVFWQLVRSKNGMLRKILIVFFMVEAFVYAFSGVYWYMIQIGETDMSVAVFRMIVLIPKALIELVFLIYLVKQKHN